MTLRKGRIIAVSILAVVLFGLALEARHYVWLGHSQTTLTAVGRGVQSNYDAYRSLAGTYLLFPDESYQAAYVVDPDSQFVGVVDHGRILVNLDVLVITNRALPRYSTRQSPGLLPDSQVTAGVGYVAFWVDPSLQYRVDF